MKVLKVIVDKLPENCLECIFMNCNLPMTSSRSGYTSDKILSRYRTKRHEECVLTEEKDKNI
jgi:hypothetical protein